MSYSFAVRGATIALALAAASEAFAKVVEAQPVHAADQAPALGAASVFAELLTPNEAKDVQINMQGSLSWGYSNPPTDKPTEFTGVNVGVSVHHVERIPVQPADDGGSRAHEG